jgi:hypothetical protein
MGTIELLASDERGRAVRLDGTQTSHLPRRHRRSGAAVRPGPSATCGVRPSRRSAGCSAGASRWCPGLKPRPSVLTRSHTGATARWPQPMNCASGQWVPMRPCRNHQEGTSRPSADRPRSGTAAPWMVLGSTSSSRPRTPPIRRCDCSATKPSLCRCGRNRHRPSSGQTSRLPLGCLTSPIRLPMCVGGATGSGAILGERGSSSGTWRTGTASFARSMWASGCIWIPGTSSPTTWRVCRGTTTGRVQLDCKLGTYFHSLSTSEALDPELTEAFAVWPDSDPDVVWPRLERRTWLHERVRDPVGRRPSVVRPRSGCRP